MTPEFINVIAKQELERLHELAAVFSQEIKQGNVERQTRDRVASELLEIAQIILAAEPEFQWLEVEEFTDSPEYESLLEALADEFLTGLSRNVGAPQKPRWEFKPMEGRAYPHCDQRILHSPGICEICDKYGSDLQQERLDNGVNFTDTNNPDLQVCPAIAARGDAVNYWHGNRAQSDEVYGSITEKVYEWNGFDGKPNPAPLNGEKE